MTFTITRRHIVVALLIVLVTAGAVVGGLVASRETTHDVDRPVPGILQCSGKVQSKPRSYVLACADYNAELVKIRWTSWSSDTATARATYSFNNCTPYCAAGKFVSFPATVKLSSPKRTKTGLLFAEAVVTYKNSSGKHVSVTQQLPTVPLPAFTTTTAPTPVGSGYLANGNGYVIFIQWQADGTAISGTAQDDYANGTTPSEEVSTNTDTVTGELNGSQISISFNGGADTFGTVSGGSFTLDFPQSNGSLVPTAFQSASASQFNQALAALQAAVNAADTQTQQADTVNRDESTIAKDVSTVNGDISGLGQDATAATGSLGSFSGTLATEKSDVATTASDEQSVAGEAKQLGATDNPQVCSDSDGVASDADGVASDADGVSSDADGVEGALTTVRNDIGSLQSDFGQLQRDEAVLPSYQANAPTQANVNAAIASANKAISSTVSGANAAIDQANDYQTDAYKDAEAANLAGGCGTPPSPPEVQPHIS